MTVNSKFYRFDGSVTCPIEINGGISSSAMLAISAAGSNKQRTKLHDTKMITGI